MSHRPTPRLAVALLAAALACAAAVPAGAADLDEDWGGPPRPPAYGFDRGPPPVDGPYGPRPRFVAAPPPPCRVIVRRHLDPYGDLAIRRVRVCDGPHGHDGPFDGFGPPPWRRSGW